MLGLSLLTAILISHPSFAYTPAEGNISAVVGPFFSKTYFKEDRAKENEYMQGSGIMALGDFNDHAALEIGIFYMNKNYYRLLTPSLVAERARLFHITMGYRRYLGSIFSVSGSIFSTYSMGEATSIYNDLPPGSPDVDTSARDITEYGVDFALQTELWTNKVWGLTLDTRYSLSLTKKEHERSDHYGALIGIKYLIQEKFPDKGAKKPSEAKKSGSKK